ncbi:MAG: DUF4835 family protein [Rubricoccaceae bacterium]|nr:DUF4835 family protein [Rubricoccaceae bacterium]
MRRLFFLAILLAAAIPARAQELRCSVDVNISALQGTEFTHLNDLEEEIERYLNDRAWTDDSYLERERIDCAMTVLFQRALNLNTFEAQVTVTASRPIYGTRQRTTTLVIQDNRWGPFTYTQGQGLIYSPNRFDAFVSVLDFYANLILGYDYDTFEELGGQPYFERARAIAELARGVDAEGWFVVGDERTRGALIQQLLDPRYAPLRRAYFDYHYGVLDHFTTAHEEAWDTAMEVLAALNELYNEFNARRFATDVFFSAKYNELAELLEDAPRRNEAYELLVEMDAPHLATYDQIVQ